MAVCFLNIISNIMQINLVNDYIFRNLYSDDVYQVLAEKNDSRVAIVSGLYGIFLMSSFFIIGRWLFVSSKINHLSHVKNLIISPGWAVGWYFVPFANFVMPYRSLKETFKASFNTEDWESIEVPHDFPTWWTTWIIGNILNNASLRLKLNLGESTSLTQLNQIEYLDICIDLLYIINSFALLRIIEIVSNNQKDKNFTLTSKGN
tara:strand:- start:454 stop:1068 length:615 start_codon:yes stop_codon:yes gene_type:complete